MTSLVVVGRPASCAGFALAGLHTAEATEPSQGAELVMACADRPNAGVLLVEQAFYDAISEADRRTLSRRAVPIIVPFPNPTWEAHPPAPESFVLDLLQRAIGYRVRLR
jgi:vacuolar-type H+-ATPase subunit F/Vma7